MALAEPKVATRPGPRLQSFGWIDTPAALAARADDWRALEARADAAEAGFQSFDWIRIWAERWAGGDPLSVLTAESDDGLAMIWPLVVRRALGVGIAEGLGEPMCQYHDALIDPTLEPAPLVAAALRALTRKGVQALRLRRVRADSALAIALLDAGATVVSREKAPYVDLVGGRIFQAERGGKSAATRRRRLRQLEERGPVAFGLAAGPAQAREWIATAMRFKRAWALDTGQLARAAFDPRFEQSFVDALSGDAAGARPRVFGMTIGERLVGVEIALSYRGRLFGHVLSHDPALKTYGIGALLADASITQARAEGHRHFDLLAPANLYKLAWADGDADVLDLALSFSARGAAVSKLCEGMDRGLRLIAHKAPKPLARAWMRRAERRLGGDAAPR